MEEDRPHLRAMSITLKRMWPCVDGGGLCAVFVHAQLTRLSAYADARLV